MSDRLFVYMVFLAGMAAGCACMASIAAGKSTAPPAPSPTTIAVTPGDTAAAKETCRRRHLAWSRLEVSVDGTRLGIVCESEDIVRQQVLQCVLVKRGGK